jgi:hypothetical protein
MTNCTSTIVFAAACRVVGTPAPLLAETSTGAAITAAATAMRAARVPML